MGVYEQFFNISYNSVTNLGNTGIGGLADFSSNGLREFGFGVAGNLFGNSWGELWKMEIWDERVLTKSEMVQ